MSLPINFPSTPSIVTIAVEWLARGDAVGMITLINIEGNAPYPIGSQMLVNQNGEYHGQITGGCAEQALADQAVAAIKSGQNATQRYGLDSPFFDIQLPCGSGIDVYFDVTTSTEFYQSLDAELKNRQVVEQILNTSFGEFSKSYRPNPRVIIFGQGPIMRSLSLLSVLSGVEVLCVAQDEVSVDDLAAANIKSTILIQNQNQFIKYCDPYTALVSLFHEHDYETDILRQALSTDLFFIGALGSRRTHQTRLQSLRDLGVAPTDLDRVVGPVGVDIQAETPEQIAVSILAQLIHSLPKQND